MKRKKLLPLFAMLTAGSILFLSGCGNADVSNANSEETTLSVEVEQEILAEGTVSVHSVWYDAAGDKLSQATIAFYDGEDPFFSGTTDENGNLEACILPCNTVLYCLITDNAGRVCAECNLTIKLSEEYTDLTIYPTEEVEDDELAESMIEVPLDKTDLRAAVFLTDSGSISFSSLTPYVEPEEEVIEEEEAVDEAVEEDIEATEEVEEVAEEETEETEESENENNEDNENEDNEDNEE